MDFWAQHKDFVLKVAAGFAVFIVALIARGIVFGDDLEAAQGKNAKMASDVRKMKISDIRTIQALQDDTGRLRKNAQTIIDQIGWSGPAETLELELIKRVLGYLRPYREDPGRIAGEARSARAAILASAPSGFGALRGQVDDEFGAEAGERNIRIDDGLGFQHLSDVRENEVEKYLLQLELVSRVVRACIDQGSAVKSIEEVRITTKAQPAVSGANPAFIREFAVRIRFKSTLPAATAVLQELNERPVVSLRELKLERTARPRDHVMIEFTVLATAATLHDKVPFVDPEKKGASK